MQKLVIFSKLPSKGFSKTRLIQSFGEEGSFELSVALLKDFAERLKKRSLNLDLFLEITPKTEECRSFFKELFPIGEISFQEEVHFFTRLSNLFKKIENETFIHLTGSDIPDFPFEIFSEVNEDSDVFIGPDLDGGFYYLGAKAKHHQIFNLENVKDGEVTVLDSLVKQCEKLNLKVKILKEWSDIDTKEDLLRTLDRNVPGELPNTFQTYAKLKESK